MKRLKWTVEIRVDKSWIADGFDLTNERAKAMVAKTLPFANNSEFSARVIGKPDRKEIRKAQGY
jgi:hypothetical protein